MIHIPHLRFYIMGHLVAKVSGVNEGAYSLYCPSWNVLWYLLFCLIWDKRDKWLLKLCREMYSSKEQANRIPKQKKILSKGAGEFSAPSSACMQMIPVSGSQMLGLLSMTFTALWLGVVGSLTKRNCLIWNWASFLLCWFLTKGTYHIWVGWDIIPHQFPQADSGHMHLGRRSLTQKGECGSHLDTWPEGSQPHRHAPEQTEAWLHCGSSRSVVPNFCWH